MPRFSMMYMPNGVIVFCRKKIKWKNLMKIMDIEIYGTKDYFNYFTRGLLS